MSRLLVGVATVAAVIGVADRAHAQATPGQRRLAPAAAEPADPANTWDKKVALGLETGLGGVLSAYDEAQSPSALLFYASLRGVYAFTPHWFGGLALRQWWLPNANHATLYALTARYEPPAYKYGRVFVDAAAGAASTSYAWNFGFDIGGGVEWDIPDAAGFSLGPFLRYNQVLNPDSRTSNDGRAWAVGVGFSYHFGRAAAGVGPKSGDVPRRSSSQTGGGFKIGVPDSDRDGVGDDQDVCRSVPQGKHPDPFKPGCPENDEDGDEVPDVDDACPVSVPGPNPDPKRPGCPLVDTDKDGIADPDDACPLKPGPATADPAHYGCPTGEKKKAAEEEAPPPGGAESPSAPSTVKKRNKMK